MIKLKITFFLIMLAVIGAFIISRSAFNEKMYDFNFPLTSNQTESFPFEIKTPTQVPFAEMKVSDFKIRKDKEEVVISLLNADLNMIDIRISELESEYAEDKKERVTIENNVLGDFISNDSDRRILTWEDDKFYEIIYYPTLTPKELSKTKLIKMAESFN